MDALTDDEIRGAFVNCSKGTAKSAAMPPGFDGIRWDQRDFLGWYDPKFPARAYLAVPHEGRLVTLLLRAGDNTAPRRGSALCTICHCARMANEIVLFAVPRAGTAGRQGNTVGTYICADLNCSLYARGLLRLSLPQGESLPAEERTALLRERLAGFVKRVLEGA